MKLKLEALKDVNVLQVSGPITPESFAILKAGIKKLFGSGKNKIILELLDSGVFPTPILRDLAVLNLMASELSGQIVLAQITPLTRAKIEAFSKPPVVQCFSDRTKAMEFFYPNLAEQPSAKTPATAPTPIQATSSIPTATPVAPTPALAPTPIPTPAPVPVYAPPPPAAAPALSEDQQRQFKKDIRAKELGDVGEIRRKLSELETENKELKTRLAELMIVRRDPPDLDSWKEKTAKLEKDLEAAIKMAQDAAGAKK